MESRVMIPFVDLHAQHAAVRAEIDEAIAAVLDRSAFIGGDALEHFESELAHYLGVKEAVGVSNGTDALWLALVAAGVRPGDGVITTPNTFIATVEAITRAGAHPMFVDIDLDTALMSPLALQAFLEGECFQDQQGRLQHNASGRPVTAVLPVHLYGLMADLPALQALCDEYGLVLVEDACQAHGAACRVEGVWKKAGSLGSAAAFSFYPGKNLGAIGDAGAVVTNDAALAAQMRVLRNHGSDTKYVHTSSLGWNARLDAIQAAVLSVKLKKLDEWNECRRQAAAQYHRQLQGTGLVLPVEPPDRQHVFHLYVVRTEQRDRLRQELAQMGIDTGIHYPIPLHLQKAYEWLNLPPGSYPAAEKSAQTIVSLPMHPYLTPDQVAQVCQACEDILRRA